MGLSKTLMFFLNHFLKFVEKNCRVAVNPSMTGEPEGRGGLSLPVGSDWSYPYFPDFHK